MHRLEFYNIFRRLGMKISKELYDELILLQGRARMDEKGRELHNPEPAHEVLPHQRPLTLREQIQRVIRDNVSREAMESGHETFDEANDFDVGTEFETDPSSKYELMEDEVIEDTIQEPDAPQETEPEEQAAESPSIDPDDGTVHAT